MTQDPNSLLIGKSCNGEAVNLFLSMSNRHGLISGATGTGKTVTLQRLAEGFSRSGVSVFMADVKGDLAGLAGPAVSQGKIAERVAQLGMNDYQPRPCPVLFWDLFGQNGHPLRATISDLGPLLLSRLMRLSEVQEGVLNAAFKLADDDGLLLLDLKDLKALLGWMADNADELQTNYGNVTKATVGAIQRGLLELESAGAERFFGEPALKLEHLMQRDFSGQGVISILDATRLIQDGRLYSTFLLWLLSELFEELPEAGDLNQPKLVFFFDEAHLLFEDIPQALLEKIEQVVRLIRSKGVGVFFVTQNPLDIPEDVLGQLGNRVQHALRAFTPKEQRAVKAAAETFRPNPKLDVAQCIGELAVGEALVSMLDGSGTPTPVERVLIAPPESQLGPIAPEKKAEIIKRSPLAAVYEERLERESAYELITQRLQKTEQDQKPLFSSGPIFRDSQQESPRSSSSRSPASSPGRQRQSLGEAFIKSAARSVGSSLGRQLLRGVLGSLMKGGR